MTHFIQQDIVNQVEPLLIRPHNDDRPIVLMTCGLAGSGKTTLAKTVLARMPQYTRLSLDEIIFREHGMYGVDYPADDTIHQTFQDEADTLYLSEFTSLLQDGRDVILDRAFYAKEDRDEFRDLIRSSGARSVLVYLKATDKELSWRRICTRNQGERDANSALDISRETFEMYWNGFEEPVGEDEIVFHVS